MRKRSFRSTFGLSFRLLVGLATLCGMVVLAGGQRGVTAASSYTFGNESSWIRVQNIGDANANVEVDYFDEQGQLAGKDTCPSATCPALFPGSGWTFFQRDNPNLPPGFQGSAVVSTDQPIVALQAKDVFRGQFYAIAGDTVSTGPGSHQLFLPLTAKSDGPNSDWNGRFVIQNLSDTVTACVTITYLSNSADDEIAWDPYRLPASGTPRNSLPGCPNGGMPVPPRGSLFRDPDTMNVPAHYTGSVRIDLSKNAAGQTADKQFITASYDTWNSDINSFASSRGLDVNELGTQIDLPLIDRQVGPDNSYSTRFQIVNKSPSQPAQVTLHFEGYDVSKNPEQLINKTNTLTVKAARMCFQDRDDYANCLAPGDALPFDFVGTVTLSSTQPVGVDVLRSTTDNDTFTDYRGTRPQDAGTRVLLPVLNKNYGPVPGVANGWNSWFRVMVADGGTANVTVTYYGLDLPGGSVSYTVPVNREFTVFQYAESMLPDGFAGTAIITADRPIVAIADLTTDVFQGDPDLTYNGVTLP